VIVATVRVCRPAQERPALKRLFLKAAGAAAAGALLHACGGGSGSSDAAPAPTGTGTRNLLQAAQDSGQHTLFVQAAQRAGLTTTLGAAGAGLTMFAPTDQAFAQLAARLGMADGTALIAALNPEQWVDILNFHLVPQQVSVADMRASNSTRPDTRYVFDGDAAQLIFVVDGGTLNIWDGIGRSSITLAQGDVAASNGLAHFVNDLLLPRGVLTVSQMLRANIDSFAHFAASLTPSLIAELDALASSTVFVPSDVFFSSALSPSVVRDHVLAQTLGSVAFPSTADYTTLLGQATHFTRGGTPPEVRNGREVLATLTDSTPATAAVIDVDFYASNGVIHVLDKVLVPT
jgi:uncharacterized surface protein with fasciclin (FAS1) repeats